MQKELERICSKFAKELDLKGKRGTSIDFLEPKHLTFPIMKGKDCFKRLFYSFSIKFMDGRVCVWTIFQRYCNNPDFWVLGGPQCTFLWQDCVLSGKEDPQDFFKRLEKLVMGSWIKNLNVECSAWDAFARLHISTDDNKDQTAFLAHLVKVQRNFILKECDLPIDQNVQEPHQVEKKEEHHH